MTALKSYLPKSQIIAGLVLAAILGTITSASATPRLGEPRTNPIQLVSNVATDGVAQFKAWVRYFNPLDGSQRIDNLRAGVFFNDTLAALKYAFANRKPLVMVMVNRYSLASARLISDILPCPSVARFAQHAVFLVTEPGDMATYDIGGKVIADALKVRGYPTISVIAPNPNKIVELKRFEGYFHADLIGTKLETALAKYIKGQAMSIAEAERQFRISGLAYKGHPIGTCASNTLRKGAGSYTTPAQLVQHLAKLQK